MGPHHPKLCPSLVPTGQLMPTKYQLAAMNSPLLDVATPMDHLRTIKPWQGLLLVTILAVDN